jgi:hypothetical protein
VCHIKGGSLWLPAFAVAICLVAVGCGDDDGEDAGQATAAAGVPAPKQSPEAFARELANLISETARKRDCKPLDAINARSLYRFPCPSPEPVRGNFAFLEVLDSATHGTGAVVDYKSEESPRGASMVLYQAPDREWGISHFGLFTEASAESDDTASRGGYDEAITGYLQAVRERDCDNYTEYAAMGDVKAEDLPAACRRAMPATKRLGATLRANRGTKPIYLGGSDTYGFYRLELEKPKPLYLHFTVFKTPEGTLRPFLVQTPTFAPAS